MAQDPTSSTQGPRRTLGGRGQPIPADEIGRTTSPTFDPVAQKSIKQAKEKRNRKKDEIKRSKTTSPTQDSVAQKSIKERTLPTGLDLYENADRSGDKYAKQLAEKFKPDRITSAIDRALGLPQRSKADYDRAYKENLKDNKDMLKRGGKVKHKKSYTKRYAMNRGGMTPVRKPTRA